MRFVPMIETGYSLFHKLLNAYYRDGEDAQSPQEEINNFIRFLYDLCNQGKISGCVAYEDAPVGFGLWNVDSADGPFSNKPGYGTILEIGILPDFRGRGLGKILVDYAEAQMEVPGYYVCAYGPAECFWKKCGYQDSGEIARNGLKLLVK